MKQLILLLCLCLPLALLGQSAETPPSSRTTLQVGILPALLYNSVAVGVGVERGKLEHVLELNGFYIPLAGESYAMGLHYNLNLDREIRANYWAFWTGIRRVNRDNNFEDGGPNYNMLHIRLGAGIGTRIPIKGKERLKLEANLGAALRLEDKITYWDGRPAPFRLAFQNFTVAEMYPVLPVVRLKIRLLLPL